MAEEPLHGKTDIVVDGNISADKLLQLIEHNAEEDFLDYKLRYDHKDKEQLRAVAHAVHFSPFRRFAK